MWDTNSVWQYLHCALSLAAQCIVIGPVCDSGVCNGRAGGRADGVRTLLQPARAVFPSLWALFRVAMCSYSKISICGRPCNLGLGLEDSASEFWPRLTSVPCCSFSEVVFVRSSAMCLLFFPLVSTCFSRSFYRGFWMQSTNRCPRKFIFHYWCCPLSVFLLIFRCWFFKITILHSISVSREESAKKAVDCTYSLSLPQESVILLCRKCFKI